MLGFRVNIRGRSTLWSILFSTSRIVYWCSSSRFRGTLLLWIAIGRRSTITTLCVQAIWRILEDGLPIVIHTGNSLLLPAQFERCVPLDMKIKGTSVSPTLSVDLMSGCTSSPPDIAPYLCLPPPVGSMHFGIEAFRWHIADNATLTGVNKILSEVCLPHQRCQVFDDVLTAVFDRALVIVIPSHILRTVQFPLLGSLMISHASHGLLEAIPVFEVSETQSGVLYLRQSVIIHLHAILLDPTLDISVVVTRHKRVVGCVLQVPLKATLSIGFPWLNNEIAQRSTDAGLCFFPQQRRWQWLRR